MDIDRSMMFPFLSKLQVNSPTSAFDTTGTFDPNLLGNLTLAGSSPGINPYAGSVPNNALQSLEDYNYHSQYSNIGNINPSGGGNNWFNKLFSKSGMNAFGSGAQGLASIYGIYDSIQKRKLMKEAMKDKRTWMQWQADNQWNYWNQYGRPRTQMALNMGVKGQSKINVPKMKKLQLA